MKSSKTEKAGKPNRVNMRLLPFKIHYFLAIGGIAAVVPYLPVTAKQIGISATALGIGYSIIPFLTFLCSPIIGFLVDYFQNVKVFIIVLLISITVGYATMFSLPLITHEEVDAMYLRITRFNESEPLLNISTPFERSCLENILQNYTECKLMIENENKVMYNNQSGDLGSMVNMTYNLDLVENNNKTERDSYWITFYIKDVLLFKKDLVNALSVQCSPPIHHCSIDVSQSIFSGYQFWLFLILLVLVSIASTSADSLTNVACLELLGANTQAFGRQRLFGTIGWGLVCPLSGLLSDQFKSSVVFVIFLMAIFRTTDIMILCMIPLPKAHISSDMSRDLRFIVTSMEILVFSCGVAFYGFVSSIISVFEFWFLEDLGASRTLLGLSIFMQCLVGEVPFLFFSGWIVRKIGHFLCFACVFFGLLLRLAFYFLLKDPWLVLPIDTLHGITYGLFIVTMTSFAKGKAPKGMEATLLGLFYGLRLGLGYGLGSLLGGIGLDKLGPRKTFFCACMLSLGCFLSLLLASYVFRREPKVVRQRQSSKFRYFQYRLRKRWRQHAMTSIMLSPTQCCQIEDLFYSDYLTVTTFLK